MVSAAGVRGREAIGQPEARKAREQVRGAADAVEQTLQHQDVRLPRRDGRGAETDDGADGCDDVGQMVRK
jgi:hypothetical protein